MYCAEGSKPAFSRRLALFHNFPTEAGVEQTEWIDIRPTASPVHRGAVEFNISGTGTNYIDLQRTRLYVRLRLLHEDFKRERNSCSYQPPLTLYVKSSRYFPTTTNHNFERF